MEAEFGIALGLEELMAVNAVMSTDLGLEELTAVKLKAEYWNSESILPTRIFA